MLNLPLFNSVVDKMATNNMSVEERLALITRNTMEIVTEDELRQILEAKDEPLAYIGFEPSGIVHMGWALVTSKIKDLCDAGFKVIILWADWHAAINDKVGGDLDNIRAVAKYMEDCFIALGVPREKVEFRYAQDVVNDLTYWGDILKVGKVTSLSRIKRTMTIMGRKEDEADLDSSKIIYPLMQCVDMFHLGVDLAYAGIDQRRVHMLAREVADRFGWKKPVAIHTPLLPGLKGGSRMNGDGAKDVSVKDVAKSMDDQSAAMIDMKMSKSDPTSSINIHDAPDSVKQKIKKAYCPPEKENESTNPILMMAKYILFPRLCRIDIERPEKYGGNVSYESYEALTEAYFSGDLSPVDLKAGVVDGINKVLAPVGEYFSAHPENYEKVQNILASLGKLR